jgi:hypothetical protein
LIGDEHTDADEQTWTPSDGDPDSAENSRG